METETQVISDPVHQQFADYHDSHADDPHARAKLLARLGRELDDNCARMHRDDPDADNALRRLALVAQAAGFSPLDVIFADRSVY